MSASCIMPRTRSLRLLVIHSCEIIMVESGRAHSSLRTLSSRYKCSSHVANPNKDYQLCPRWSWCCRFALKMAAAHDATPGNIPCPNAAHAQASTLNDAPCQYDIDHLRTSFDKSGCSRASYMPHLRAYVQCVRGADSDAHVSIPDSLARSSSACHLATTWLDECLQRSGCDPSQCQVQFGAYLRCILYNNSDRPVA